MKLVSIAILSLFITLPATAQHDHDNVNCPMHDRHMKNHEAASNPLQSESRHEAVKSCGEKAMGFSQDKTTHHFILKVEGGIIRVETNNARDDENRSAIRNHFLHIVKLFSQGDFDIPMFVHDRVPPGVSVMKDKKQQINYEYQELPAGAQVIITSSDSLAVMAIHDFLRFQIQDHETGDRLSVEQPQGK